LEGEQVTFTWKDYADHDRMREMTLSGEEFLRRFLLHVLPDRFVRIRYYGLLANRHREKALALCHEVLPGLPTRPKPPKTDWRGRLQSLTGIDALRCEVCGQKALCLVGPVVPTPRGPPAMIQPPIAQSQCFFAQPQSRGVVFLDGCCGILTDTESWLRSLGMRQNPSLSGPLKATRRLSGGLWRPAGYRAKRLPGIESP
jgi:putative transposase